MILPIYCTGCGVLLQGGETEHKAGCVFYGMTYLAMVKNARHDRTRQNLLDVADGPEGICLYLSEDEAVVDWSECIPALYLTASINGAFVKLGPFQMPRVIAAVRAALRNTPGKVV